jgi:uncharacterized membrane protein YkoI
MKAKLLIATFLVLFAATAPVIAQGNGNSGGNSAQSEDDDTDESEDGDNGNSGNNQGGNNGNGDAGSNGHGNSNGGNGNGNNGGGDRTRANGEVTVVPEEDLLAIVKAGQAVSLASLLPNVEERTGGEIIDAQMVRTDRSLIYVVKVMTPEGRVGIEYYNARSGTHIEAR